MGSKGKSFEREISQKLSLWLTHGQNKDTVWYTKSSGGRATRRKKSNQISSRYDHGDLGPDSSESEFFFDVFSCELKTGYGKKTKKNSITLWSFNDILDSSQKIPIFYDFWNQAVHDAKESMREPLLIFRRNRRTACIAMRNCVFNAFLNGYNLDTISLNNNDFQYEIKICNLDDFLTTTQKVISKSFIKMKIIRSIICHGKIK